jgi:mono/diheme cytochrome c family protein
LSLRRLPGRGARIAAPAFFLPARTSVVGLTLAGALSLGLAACTNSARDEAPLTPEQKLLARGRQVYQSQCIACHNPNPRLPGSVGPDLFGSSRELIEARVLHAAYPPGHPPKRDTHLMPAQPQLKGDIDALHAYLNAPAP